MNREELRARLQQAYNEGQAAGQQSVTLGLDKTVSDLRAEFDRKLNQYAGGMRRQMEDKTRHLGESLGQLAQIANSIEATRSGGGGAGGGSPAGSGYSGGRDEGNMTGRPGTIRIEDIPGRRVPFTLLVRINVENNSVSRSESSVSISQEGPFVAVKRMAIFQSAYEFRTTDPGTGAVARFSGRSFGRYRPVSSSWDLNDSQHNAVADSATWWLNAITNPSIVIGSALPGAVLGQPSSMSSFRTMEFDGLIEVINAGSSYPRQNIPVPSAFWSKSINSPWDLGALDFFERGEVLTVRAQPLHVNNPPTGNVDGDCVFPQTGNRGTGYPFLAGQYDSHEGICTPGAATLGDDNPVLPNVLATDSVQRLPDGILTLGWEGYKIIQPIGPAV